MFSLENWQPSFFPSNRTLVAHICIQFCFRKTLGKWNTAPLGPKEHSTWAQFNSFWLIPSFHSHSAPSQTAGRSVQVNYRWRNLEKHRTGNNSHAPALLSPRLGALGQHFPSRRKGEGHAQRVSYRTPSNNSGLEDWEIPQKKRFLKPLSPTPIGDRMSSLHSCK